MVAWASVAAKKVEKDDPLGYVLKVWLTGKV